MKEKVGERVIEVNNYDTLYPHDFEGAESIGVEMTHVCEYGDDICRCKLILYGPDIEVPNPGYEQQLADYKEEYQKYKAGLAKWKELKVLYDEQQTLLKEERERKQYAQLKKKFGK